MMNLIISQVSFLYITFSLTKFNVILIFDAKFISVSGQNLVTSSRVNKLEP